MLLYPNNKIHIRMYGCLFIYNFEMLAYTLNNQNLKPIIHE